MNKTENNWQLILSQGFASAKDLLQFLQINDERFSFSAEKLFKTRVPLGFAKRMKKGDPSDPLLRQVLAVEEEIKTSEGYVKDPLQEQAVNHVKGLLHKYESRVLLLPTSACAVNCRYCFRRHFPYEDNRQSQREWDAALNYIAADPRIKEVILSGGDPLMTKDSVLFALIDKLALIKHVSILRFHSRIPVVLPERIDSAFIAAMKEVSLNKIMVLHINHPNEINDDVISACRLMKEAGLTLLNQSVLLHQVNDNADILVELSYRLFAAGVLPYYLHLLDPVEGTHHFHVPHDVAKKLFATLQKKLSGYLVPRLVQERAGVPHKVLIPLI